MTDTTIHPVHQTHDGYFNTVSGRRISIHDPTPKMIDLEDIAHALGHICRFGGHTKPFYSVAQHSVDDLGHKKALDQNIYRGHSLLVVQGPHKSNPFEEVIAILEADFISHCLT